MARVIGIIAATRPDILLLTGFDYDLDGIALALLADRLAAAGVVYPHRFALRPNRGRPTGLDLDGDGRRGGPRDAQGYGEFNGQGGMALLSRYPVEAEGVRDFTGFLWRDLPGTLIGGAELPAEAAAVQRLPTTGHWAVPLRLPDGRVLTLLALHATPPVFDGPEDRNGRRNHDEIRFWELFLEGWAPDGAGGPGDPFVLLGAFNLDPVDGDGRRGAIRRLLAHPALQDPEPASAGAAAATPGDPLAALDTVDWPEDGPGNKRVDFVLPAAGLRVTGSGVFWPARGEPGSGLISDGEGPRHRLVWVEID